MASLATELIMDVAALLLPELVETLIVTLAGARSLLPFLAARAEPLVMRV